MKEKKSKFGEFICSYFSWVGLEEQRKKVEELENTTKTEKNEEKER